MLRLTAKTMSGKIPGDQPEEGINGCGEKDFEEKKRFIMMQYFFSCRFEQYELNTVYYQAHSIYVQFLLLM